MAGETFRDTAPRYAPRGVWLRDDTTRDYLSSLGGAVADSLELYRHAVEVRYARTAPDDALPLIGDNRQLPQAPEETDDDYRLRLPRAFEIHGDRTLADAYRHALEPLGVSPDLVTVYGETDVGEHTWWSGAFVFVDITAGPWTVDEWEEVGDEWDDGGVWDLNGLTYAQLAFTRRMIRRWKWAGAFPVMLFAWASGAVWTPGDTWEPAVWLAAETAFPLVLGYTWDAGDEYYAETDAWDDGSSWEEPFPE